ncbi:hypothetical protein HPB50_027519 [Hyalomma asiaticum]|uniref:Uncharacterized protein n=1 Tax=Hyalomma asiaticum TaxID=266040 RepID=A0ACB7SRR3_HYAAI|nr:hypothetical protein HPB50_027519 [Hyalomma asiaticum]
MISRRTVVGPLRPVYLGSVTYIQSHIFAMVRFSSVLSLGMAVGDGEETTEDSVSLHWSRTQPGQSRLSHASGSAKPSSSPPSRFFHPLHPTTLSPVDHLRRLCVRAFERVAFGILFLPPARPPEQRDAPTGK